MTSQPGPPGSLLNLDASRPPVEPVDAATLAVSYTHLTLPTSDLV